MNDIKVTCVSNRKDDTEKLLVDAILSSTPAPQVLVNEKSPSKDDGWGKVKKQRVSFANKSVDKYNHRDVAMYASSIFEAITGEALDHGPGYGPLRMREIGKQLSLIADKPQPISRIKEYIDFYFKSKRQTVREKKDVFTLQFMIEPRLMRDFLSGLGMNSYDKKSDPNISRTKKKNDRNKSVTREELELISKLGLPNLLMKYGLLVSLAWLNLKGEIEPESEIVNQVSRLCKRSPDYWKTICDVTQSNAPYPKWMQIDIDDLVLKISVKSGIKLNKISISDNSVSRRYSALNPRKFK